MKIPIIDAHLDLAYNALSFERDITEELSLMNAAESHMTDYPSRNRCTVSLPELSHAGVYVAVATLLSRAPRDDQRPAKARMRSDLDWPSADMAHATAQAQLAYYQLLTRRKQIRFLRTAKDLKQHWQSSQNSTAEAINPLGVILSMEGADPITTPEEAPLWFEMGLRCVGLSHYGLGRYSPGTGCEGPLTEAGVALLKEFEKLGMIVDVTHLADEALLQTLDLYNGPVIASHHNCRALVPAQRQLPDEHIQLLINRKAVIGMAFDAWMLYPGWERGETDRSNLQLDSVINHIDHVCQIAGNCQHVGIGSDLDGGFGTEQCPTGLETIADLQKVSQLLSQRGYNDDDIQAIFHGNWYRFFTENLPQGNAGLVNISKSL